MRRKVSYQWTKHKQQDFKTVSGNKNADLHQQYYQDTALKIPKILHKWFTLKARKNLETEDPKLYLPNY